MLPIALASDFPRINLSLKSGTTLVPKMLYNPLKIVILKDYPLQTK